jgi:mono/diheme cytochrome c family protein
VKAAARIVACVAIAAGAAIPATLLQRAQEEAARVPNPFEGDTGARRAGAKLYVRECSACHGANREGRGKAPPLNRPEICKASAGTLFWILRNGALRQGMPSFAHLPEPRRWQIITYLRAGGPDRHD